VTEGQGRALRGWRRALVLAGILAGAYGLAVLVARPHVPDPATNPYVGQRGGSLSKSAGLEIRFRRGEEDRAVEPQTVLRAGDRLRFTVKGEAPRFLEIRMRDGAAGPVTTVFPTGTRQTVQVAPGQTLDVAPVLGPDHGKLVVTALFSDRARLVGVPADPDTRASTVIINKE
jgi:hypothetical protein